MIHQLLFVVNNCCGGESAVAIVEMLVFEVGDTVLGVDIAEVVEVTTARKITTIPNMPKAYEGVCDSRGTIIPVVNLYNVLSVTELPERMMFVTCSYTDITAAFMTGRVHGIMRVDSTDIMKPPQMYSKNTTTTCKLKGVVASDKHNVLLVALDDVLEPLGLAVVKETKQK